MKFNRREETYCSEITDALEKQNVVVGRARDKFLALKAEVEHFESNAMAKAEGKSQSEKRMNAAATDEWLEFQRKLKRAESIYEFEKFKLSVLDKEWLDRYQVQKENEHIIKRQGA